MGIAAVDESCRAASVALADLLACLDLVRRAEPVCLYPVPPTGPVPTANSVKILVKNCEGRDGSHGSRKQPLRSLLEIHLMDVQLGSYQYQTLR